jgi:carboxymethylenebutenolidase
MCHQSGVSFFGKLQKFEKFSAEVDGLLFPNSAATGRVAVLPDIYGLTEFYKGYASYLADFGAQVYLTNPWSEFGELPDNTREAAYERRGKLRDNAHCDQLETFLSSKKIQTVIGFCLGGNFAFELARRGFKGTLIAVYPLPWGMQNQDEITPAFEYMPTLAKKITVFMGAADHLAGADNIRKLENIASDNESLTLHLYKGSNHGFFADIDGPDQKLKLNAKDAIDKINKTLFAG